MPVGEDFMGDGRPQQYLTSTWGADQNTGDTYLNPAYTDWYNKAIANSWASKNPFADEAAYNAQAKTTKGLGGTDVPINYIPWKDYSALWNDWSAAVGDKGPTNMSLGYGAGNTPFKTANNLYSMGYDQGGWSRSGGAENYDSTWSDPSMSVLRYLTEQEAPGGWALSIDPMTGQIKSTVSTHGENSNFFTDMAPLALTALGANFLPGMFGDSTAGMSLAQSPESIASFESALPGATDVGFNQAASDILGNGLGNISSMMSNPVTDTLAQATGTVASDAGGGALHSTLMDSLGNGAASAADADLAAGLDPSASYDAFMTANPVTQGAMSAATSKALFPGLEALFDKSGFIGQNKNLLNLLGAGYSIYSNNQKAGALNDIANRQNNLAQQNINNQKATQDTLMNAYNNMYAPGSPEYNLMQQTIARQDAQAGRNSQYGQRAENLAAKIAGIKGNLLPQIMSAASSGTNQAYSNALSAMNQAMSPATTAASLSSSGLAPLFTMLGQAQQNNNGVNTDPQTLMKIIQTMTQKT